MFPQKNLNNKGIRVEPMAMELEPVLGSELHSHGAQTHGVTLRFPKYVKTETRRESATYVRKENTSRIYAKPKVTWTSYIIY